MGTKTVSWLDMPLFVLFLSMLHFMPLLRLNRAIAFIGFVIKPDMWRDQAMHAGPYQFNRTFLDEFFS